MVASLAIPPVAENIKGVKETSPSIIIKDRGLIAKEYGDCAS